MKPRQKALCIILALVMLLPMFAGTPALADELSEPAADADVAVVVPGEDDPQGDDPAIPEEVSFLAASAADLGTIKLEDWKIAPEGAISIAPWKEAGAGDASAPAVSTANWIPAKVPGTVLGNLIDAGVYDAIFEANNEGEKDVYFNGNMRHIPRDDFAGWWWYSVDFDVTADQLDNYFNLNLKNMSYQGEVFVNGTQLFNENRNITDVKELLNKESVDRVAFPEYTAFSNPPPPYVYTTDNIGLTATEVNNSSNINFGRPLGAPWRVQSDGAEGESGGIRSSVAQFGHGDFDKYSKLFMGAFRTYDVDITDHIKAGTNTVRIKVKRMFNVADFGPFWHDWHPTTSDNNMGLTGSAALNITGEARLANPMVGSKVVRGTVTTAGNGDASLSFYVNVTNMSDKPVTAVLSAVIKDPDGVVLPNGVISGVSATIPAGAYNWDVPVVENLFVPNAQLWWTNGSGGQPLYTVDHTISVGGVVSDTLYHRFGIRELIHEVNNRDATGSPALQIFINHQPIVMKGGGFGALDHFYRMDDLTSRNFVEAVRTMGHNMWRDEGKFYSEDLYDLMDENGLLLMTGFMCCDRNEVSNATGWSSAERMIIYEYVYSQMRIMRSHASGWAFLSGSDRAKSAAGNTAANPSGVNMERKMWEIAGRVRWFQVGNVVASAVAGGSAITGAGTGVIMGGGYETVPAGKFYQGLSLTDNTTGAYGGMAGFYSETAGGMGVPVTETLKKVLPKANWWPYNKGNGGALGDGPGNWNIWNYLNARGGCFEALDISNLFVEYAFGPSNSIEEYNIRAQLFQYDQQRGIHEALHVTRFNKGTGFVNWMLNSPRPSTFWNQIDYYINPIGNSFGSAKGNAPVHVAYDQFSRRAFAMNSTREDYADTTATLRMFDIYGNQINKTLEKTFTLKADGVTSWSGTTIDRPTGFNPIERNGDDWFEKGFEPFMTQYSTGNAGGRRAAGASGNVDLWDNAAITGSLIRPTTDVYFISLELRDKDGELFSRNDYAVGRRREVTSDRSSAGRQMSQAADLTQVNLLPKVNLTVTQNPGGLRANDSRMWEQTVTITNPSGDIAFGIELKAYTNATKSQMTPVNYSDNLITLYPGETRTITIWHLVDNLEGKDAFIGVDCYNNIVNGGESGFGRGNNYVPGDPGSAEWAAWGLPPQTQTSATTNLARNVGSSVATVASNATGPNTPATNTGNAPTRITNATFVTFANQRANSVFDSVMAEGAPNSTTALARVPVNSAHYINLGSARTFDKIITRWNDNSHQDWTPGSLVARGVPDRVRIQISAATGATADWDDLLYDVTFDNTGARSYLVEILLDDAVTARHIRTIPSGVTGASDPFGVQNASGRIDRGPGYNRVGAGWDPTSGRLNDQVATRARVEWFSLTAVEIYHTFNHLQVDFVGGNGLKATVNGKAIAASDAPAKRTAYAFYGDKIKVELDKELFVYLDMVNVNDKIVPAAGKYTLELDAIEAPAVLTISETQLHGEVQVDIRAKESIVVTNKPVEFTVSLGDPLGVNLVSLSFTFDADFLNFNFPAYQLDPLNGFSILSGPSFERLGGNLWKASVNLMYVGGFVTKEGQIDILSIKGMSMGTLGNTKVTLTDITISGRSVAGTAIYMPYVINTAVAPITVAARAPVYSKYDLSRDGIIDNLDLTIAITYYLCRNTDPNWEDAANSPFRGVSAKDADVTGDGLVNLADLIEILANYTPSYNIFPD